MSKKNPKLLFVASEAGPFAASGGLGDVMGALPPALVAGYPQLSVSVVLPLYKTMREQYKARLEHVTDLVFHLSWRKTGASVYRLMHGGVAYYFLENHYYFDRPALYGEYDDGERFAFFSMAVVHFMLATGNIPDILHANDWQSALTVIYLKTVFASRAELSRIRTVYTVHNIEYQGKYDRAMLGDVFALDDRYYGTVEFDGCINLMKGALTVSDFVTTVSPNYACELQHNFFAHGLAGVIDSLGDKMTGVINGIDYQYFSPEHGGDIPYPYGLDDLAEGKRRNKLALQGELGLTQDPDIPLVVMITRLAGAKGIDLVSRILDELICENIQFVILGTGEWEYEDFFRRAEQRHPDSVRALIRFDRVTSKKMYAAADLFLMPSKSEPCGLSQMIACSYGTVPVVRAVGGLYDSIHPVGTDMANGFTFNNYNAHELLDCVRRALALYHDSEQWAMLSRAAKQSDFSWSVSASKYMEIYNNILSW